MTCKDFEELSGAYVLSAVTAQEHKDAQAHLSQCQPCTHLYQELSSMVGLLPLSVAQINPPATLRARVMLAIQREAAITAETTQGIPTQRIQQEAATAKAAQRAAAQHTQRASRQSWATRLLAVAATLLLALVGGLATWNASLQYQLANTSPHIVATIQSDQATTGELLYLPQKNVTVLVIHKLPQLKGSHIYQGWLLFMHDKQTVSIRSVGLLTTQGDTASVSFPGNVTGYNAAAVSLEPGPAPSISAPAGPVIATGNI